MNRLRADVPRPPATGADDAGDPASDRLHRHPLRRAHDALLDAGVEGADAPVLRLPVARHAPAVADDDEGDQRHEAHERALFASDNRNYRTTKLEAYRLMAGALSINYLGLRLVQIVVMRALKAPTRPYCACQLRVMRPP
jgi:hypothetical protein